MNKLLKHIILFPIRVLLLVLIVLLGFTVIYPKWMDHKDIILYELFDIPFEGARHKENPTETIQLDKIRIDEFSSADKNFEKCVKQHKQLSNTIIPSIKRIHEIRKLQCNERGIVNTESLNELKELRRLELNYNNIKSINLESLELLEFLSINGNKINSIQFTNNLLLRKLRLGKNNLTELDLSNLNSLVHLTVAFNPVNLSDIKFGNMPQVIIVDERQLKNALSRNVGWVLAAKLEINRNQITLKL